MAVIDAGKVETGTSEPEHWAARAWSEFAESRLRSVAAVDVGVVEERDASLDSGFTGGDGALHVLGAIIRRIPRTRKPGASFG